MKIYLIGDKEALDSEMIFRGIEEKLSKCGHIVVNPMKIINSLPVGVNNSDYVVISTGLIRICDAVYYIPGYEKSLIAGLEKGNAIRQEKPIYATNDDI